MREIKFRAWDNIHKEMSFLEDYIKEVFWPNDYIMQYTGLKDKNWKGIYDWDILKEENWYKYKVIYDNWWFQVEPIVDWMKICNTLSSALIIDSIEIIWNIYKNPNLLENDKWI